MKHVSIAGTWTGYFPPCIVIANTPIPRVETVKIMGLLFHTRHFINVTKAKCLRVLNILKLLSHPKYTDVIVKFYYLELHSRPFSSRRQFPNLQYSALHTTKTPIPNSELIPSLSHLALFVPVKPLGGNRRLTTPLSLSHCQIPHPISSNTPKLPLTT